MSFSKLSEQKAEGLSGRFDLLGADMSDTIKLALIGFLSLVLILIIVVILTGVRNRDSSYSADPQSQMRDSYTDASSIASCMQFNQRKNDEHWTRIKEDQARANAELARSMRAMGIQPSSMLSTTTSGCGAFCARPDQFRRECEADPTFIWAPP